MKNDFLCSQSCMNALESSAFPGDYVAMQTLAELEKDVAWKRIAKEKKKKMEGDSPLHVFVTM